MNGGDKLSSNSKRRRRVFGGVCLGVSLVLLLLGQTVLKARLADSVLVMLVYWMSCFLLAAMAAAVAIIDAARVQQETREEQRALIESTIRDIEREKQNRERPES